MQDLVYTHLLKLFVERQNPTFKEELSKLFDEYNLLDILYEYYEDYKIILKKSLESDIREILCQTIELHLPNAMKFLIEAGADVNVGDEWGETPIHCAARSGDIKAIEFLMNEGAEVNKADCMGRYPMRYAAQSGNNNVHAMLSLLNGGAIVPDDLREKVDGISQERNTRFKEWALEVPEGSEDSPSAAAII